MPDDSLSFSTQSALAAALRAFAGGMASESETRQAIAPAIGLPLYDAGLSAYLDVLLQRVEDSEVSTDDAASDMAEIARAVRRYDRDLRDLLVLGAK